MELNRDAGSPTRSGTQSRIDKSVASDVDHGAANGVEQEQDSSTHHRSPGRAARLALQAITRKLGRADVGTCDIAAATSDYAAPTSAPVPRKVERGNSERSLNGEEEEARQRREQQSDDLLTRQTGSFQTSSVARHLPVTTSTGTSMTATDARDSWYARKDRRVVEASSAPLVSMIPRTHNSDLRRRARGINTATYEEGDGFVEPSTRREAGRGSSNPGRDNAGDTRRQHQRQERLSSSTQSIAAHKKRLASRNPLERYLLLSAAVVLAGLTARYLWRQLAGLAGALLILASARRWRGEDRVASDTGGRKRRKTEELAQPAVDGEARHGARVDTPVAGGVGVGEWGGAFAGAPARLRRYWEDAGSECQFSVRGSNYMSDRKKIPSGRAAMRLVHVDFFSAEGEVFHVASKGRCRDRVAAFIKSFEERGETPPFLFLLNILVPGTPVVCTVMYWALIEGDAGDAGDAEAVTEGGPGSYQKFLAMLGRYADVPGSGYRDLDRRRWACSPPNASASIMGTGDVGSATRAARRDGDIDISSSGSSGVSNSSGQSSKPSPRPSGAEMEPVDATAFEGASGGMVSPVGGAGADEGSCDDGLLPADDFRNQRFKLIPSIVAGPFMVRKAVGNKPALLGRKLNQRYFRGRGYVETDVDVGSSVVAARIVGLCRGYAKSLTVELGVCIEGRCEEELPEKCIGVIRLVNLDLDGAEPLEEPKEDIDPADSPLSSATDGTSSGGKRASPNGGSEGWDRNRVGEKVSPGTFGMPGPPSIAAGGVTGRAVALNA